MSSFDDHTARPDPTLVSAPGTGTSRARQTELHAGATFDRYTILDRVGSGGMGEVYAAYDPRLDRRVALKVLRADHGADDTARQRLFREAQAMARLNHPAVVAVHDVGMCGEEVYVAMEFVDGQTLAGWLRDGATEPQGEAPAPRSQGSLQGPTSASGSSHGTHPGGSTSGNARSSARTGRTRAEILEVFRSAGEGLAAAHDAGLVHRDFKPGNVLIGHDGRVRVADFGLARDPGKEKGAGDDANATEPPRTISAEVLATPLTPLPALTHFDAMVGTPGYMPPEQFEGEALDPRADQYSFCAALYEALTGGRPFKGDTLTDLWAQMRDGLPPEPMQRAGAHHLPHHLYATLRRGLSPKVEDRWPDMRTLLAELSRDPHAVRRRRIKHAALAVAGALVLGGGAVVTRSTVKTDPCREARAPMALLGEGRRQKIETAFSSTGAAYASRAATATLEALDAWSKDWSQLRLDSCEAARVRAELPEATWAVRSACFALVGEQAQSLVQLLSTADEGLVQNAVGAVGRLPQPSACLDPRALNAIAQLPTDPAARATVERLQTRLSAMRAGFESGRLSQTERELPSLLAEAEEAGHLPLVSEALTLRARVHVQQSRYAEALPDLHAAAQRAFAGQDDVAAARAFMQLSLAAARGQGRHDEAREWLGYARSTLGRAGDPSREAVELEHLAGQLFYLRGHYEPAHAHLQKALELQEARLPSDEALRVRILDDSGWILSWLGRHAEGYARFEEAMAIADRLYGPDHPETAALYDRAGSVLEELDELERARDLLTRAIRVREAVYGADSEVVAGSWNHLALVLVRLGEPEEALDASQRALVIYRARLGDQHERVASLLHTVGLSLETQGRTAEAREHYTRALGLTEKLRGRQSAMAAYPMHGIATTLLTEGRAKEALSWLQRAWEIRERAEQLPYERGMTRFQLARALTLTGKDRARVPSLVEGARADFVASGPKGMHALAKLEAWTAAAQP